MTVEAKLVESIDEAHEDEFKRRREEQLEMMKDGDYVGIVRLGIISKTPEDPYSDARFNHSAAQLMGFAYYHDLWNNVHVHRRYKNQEFPTLLAMGIRLKRRSSQIKNWGKQVVAYVDRTSMSASEVEKRTEEFLAEHEKRIKAYQKARKQPVEQNKYEKLRGGLSI